MWSGLCATEVPFEVGTHSRPRAVQQNTLVPLRYLEGLAHFLWAAAGHVAHRDHDALGLRKLLDRVGHDLECLAAEDHLFRTLAPVGGISPPVPGKRVAGAAETLWLDRRLLMRWCQRGERDRPRLAHSASPSNVDDDRDDPGLQ